MLHYLHTTIECKIKNILGLVDCKIFKTKSIDLKNKFVSSQDASHGKKGDVAIENSKRHLWYHVKIKALSILLNKINLKHRSCKIVIN